MWVIKIIGIERIAELPEGITAFSIDYPKAGDIFKDYNLPVAGWVIGSDQPVKAISVFLDNVELIEIPLVVKRVDVQEVYHQVVVEEARVGFQGWLPFSHPSGTMTLTLCAKIDQDDLPIGKIEGIVEFCAPPIQPQLNPLILTSLGRMGSTFCMQALGLHPQIVTGRIYPYETRIAQHCIQTLSHGIQFGKHVAAPTELMEQLRQDFVQSSIQHCQNTIDQFYLTFAQANGQTNVLYFAEKSSFTESWQGWFYDIYPRTKEIILVRDFRDMFSSVFSFNIKRAFYGFSRQSYTSDGEYIRELLGPKRLFQAWQARKDRALLVKYEDIILRDEQTLTKIFEYLQVEFTPSLVRQICQLCDQPTDNLKRHMTSESRKASIGRWRQDLSPELQRVIHEVLGDILTEFGYGLDGQEF